MAGKHEGNVQSLFGQGEAVEIDVFTSGKELTETDRDYDIALLDIEMPVQDGIRIKEYFEAGRRQTTIINLYGQILEIEESSETVFIPVKQIRYIEAQDKYTLAVMGTGEHLMCKTMKFWKNILPGEE